MILTYLLDDTRISGIVRNVLAQSDGLAARGHTVRIVTPGQPLTWRRSAAEWRFVDAFAEYDARADDFLVATSPATLEAARRLAGDRAVEMSETTVAAAGASVSIGAIVDDEVYRDTNPRENDPLRVLVSGAGLDDAKGIDLGYGAVAHARWFHQTVELVRVSPWMPSREEPLDSVQEFHVALTAVEMARLLHTCDIYVGSGRREEAFDLTAAEALASGVPCVLSATPAHLSIDATPDFALFAPEENAVELGEQLIALLSDPALRSRLRARGREVAGQWRSEHAIGRLEHFFERRRVSR